jgi:hypothetical protein
VNPAKDKRKKQMKQNNEKQPINKEAFKMLAIEIGLNEAARRLGIPVPTAKSWARRGKWNLPRRKGGGVSRSLPASIASSPHPIADALDASHKELENATKTALMQALTKAAKAVAGKEALDVSNTTQLRDVCLAAARIFGWQGDSPVNVEVNNQVGVVVTEEKRRELQEKLRAIQEDDNNSENLSPAPTTLPLPQKQLQASVGAGNALSGAPRTAQTTISPSMKSLGFDLTIRESVQEPESVQEEEPEVEHSVGW